MTPVNPPNKNVTRNPRLHNMGVSNVSCPFHMVPIQLKNFTPVGTAIRNVMKLKKGRRTAPVANMWCAHTAADNAAMASVAKINPLYPNTVFRLNTGNISDTIPK